MTPTFQPVILDVTEHWKTIKHFAQEAMLGGYSQVHRNGQVRSDRLWRDQLVGQSGEAALHLYQHGAINSYVDARAKQARGPWDGDGGTDLPGTMVDVKTSWLPPGKNPNDYALFIRSAEFHPETVYYLGMMTLLRDPFQVYVALAGWVPGEEFSRRAQAYAFEGGEAQGVPVGGLYRPAPLRWEGVKYLDGFPQTHFYKNGALYETTL